MSATESHQFSVGDVVHYDNRGPRPPWWRPFARRRWDRAPTTFTVTFVGRNFYAIQPAVPTPGPTGPK